MAKKQKTQQQKTLQQLLLKLDYSITDQKERNRIVNEIVDQAKDITIPARVLEKLANYIINTQKVKKDKKILTNNRLVTVNRREMSYEQLISKLENGEDGLYNLIATNKNALLVPKITITEDDIQTIPEMRELRDNIKRTEEKQKLTSGKEKSLLTRQLIEMRQLQYNLKYSYKQPIGITRKTKSLNDIRLDENITIDERGEPVSDGLISLFNPQHISELLCNYEDLKDSCKGKFNSDWWCLMQDLDSLINTVLKEDNPVLYDIAMYKISGLQNKEIVQKIKEKYDVAYAAEYISTLWRKKIPKLLSEQAKKDWIIWHYTYEEYGQWKRCSCCHEVKLAHPYFFTRNRSSKDGWYSMCKDCRNKKNKEKNSLK